VQRGRVGRGGPAGAGGEERLKGRDDGHPGRGDPVDERLRQRLDRRVGELVHPGVDHPADRLDGERVRDDLEPGAVGGLDHRPQHRGRRHRQGAVRAALDRDLDHVDAVAGEPADGQPGLRGGGEERGEPVGAPGPGRVAVGRGEDRTGDSDVRGARGRSAVAGAQAQRVPPRRAEVADADHAAAQRLLGRAEREVHVRVDDPRADPVVPGTDDPDADRDRDPPRRADPVDGAVRGDQHHAVVRLGAAAGPDGAAQGDPAAETALDRAVVPAGPARGDRDTGGPHQPAGRPHHSRPGHRHMMLRRPLRTPRPARMR
jgi:hypothetical protein